MGVDTEINRGVFPSSPKEYVVQYPRRSPVRVRKAMLVCGVQGGVKFLIHNNSASNLRRALMERVYNVEVNGHLQKPPQPVPDIFATLAGQREALIKELPPITRMTRTQFVQSRPAEKRKVYMNALQSLKRLPVRKRDARIDSAFVKCEKINGKKGDPAPRIIQPRSPRYNLEVGCYLTAAEHHIYKAIDALWGGPTVMKGYNAEQLGGHIADAWNEFKDPVALGLDASRFDQHVSVEALEFEHGIYNAIFKDDQLARLLSWQLLNEGIARADDAIFKYSKPGSRMSGDMNTSLGNIIIMTLMVRWFLESRRVKGRLINNGDDCTLIFERADLERVLDGLHAWFLQYGFNIVQEPVVDVIERIEFCQMHPVLVGDQFIMVRNFAQSLSKDAISIRSRNAIEMRSWLWCVGKCGLAIASGVPVQQSYYECLLRAGSQGKRWKNVGDNNSGLSRFSSGMSAQSREVLPATRASFQRAFGIQPSEQVSLEMAYSQLEIQVEAPTSKYNYNLLQLCLDG